ncbi:MAG: heavy-metal-associated domain-containing protein [Terracidiphilus sp.]
MENIIQLSIEGMHCEGCVRRVTGALAALEGVRVSSVEVGSATVAADPARVSLEQIAAALDRVGFTARAERRSGE